MALLKVRYTLERSYPTQGIVLAAGLGSRMAPITDHTPKPLIRFFSVEMLEISVVHLVRAGVQRIAINARHLAGQIENFVERRLRERFPDVEFFVSVGEEVLGTGGAVVNLRDWLNPGPFWMVNSDAVFAQPLKDVAESHIRSRNDVTLMVTRADEHRALRFLRTTNDGLLVERTPEAEDSGYAFCGVHINEGEILDILPASGECCVLRAGHLPWANTSGRVRVFETTHFWADAGTPERYLEAHKRALPELESWFPRQT